MENYRNTLFFFFFEMTELSSVVNSQQCPVCDIRPPAAQYIHSANAWHGRVAIILPQLSHLITVVTNFLLKTVTADVETHTICSTSGISGFRTPLGGLGLTINKRALLQCSVCTRAMSFTRCNEFTIWEVKF